MHNWHIYRVIDLGMTGARVGLGLGPRAISIRVMSGGVYATPYQSGLCQLELCARLTHEMDYPQGHIMFAWGQG